VADIGDILHRSSEYYNVVNELQQASPAH